MLIEKRYLVIPSSKTAEKSKIRFFEDSKQIFDLDVYADEKNTEYFAYYDMKRFVGKDIELKAEKINEISFTDTIDDKTVEQNRPLIHFTSKTGWINDPNGLIYYEGKYHMFFQCNPAGRVWGNMHWGHAVSYDLVNWEQTDYALYPDEMGDMFSGSAMIDSKNLLGLKKNEHDTVVLFYTAAGNSRELNEEKDSVQCMAYSTDGMKTFQKYAGNPIIPMRKGGDRDPKVFYHQESDMYVISLYLGAGEYSFFKSKNLVDWTYINSYHNSLDRECPDLYRFGDKYVLVGANDYYVVGSFDIDKGFIAEKEPVCLGYGLEYASQTFFGTEDKIKIAWNRFENLPSKNFNCTMSIPYKLEFDGEYLRNIPYIKSELIDERKDFLPSDTLNLKQDAYDFELEIVGDNEIMLFGNKLEVKDNILKVKMLNGKIAELPVTNKIRIISDTYGLEVFTDDYRKFAAFEVVNTFGSDILKVKGAIKNLTISKVTR